MRMAEKWDDRTRNPAVGAEDWKQRARRAEAEAAAARLLAASRLLQAYARADEHERRLKEVTDSTSWRVTAPLRRINAMRTLSRRRRP